MVRLFQLGLEIRLNFLTVFFFFFWKEKEESDQIVRQTR